MNTYFSQTGVVYKIVIEGEKDGNPYYSVEFWRNRTEYDNGDAPYLLNDFKMQIRENHQRVQLDVNGDLLHKSGKVVSKFDTGVFQKTADFVKYQENPDGSVKENGTGQWIQTDGTPVTPFKYTHSSTTEYFDPQWERELFTVPLIDSAKENIENYIERAVKNGYEGDRRGTTLNLQVGASTDDMYEQESTGTVTNGNNLIAHQSRLSAGDRFWGGHRWTDSSITQGDTIDDAVIQLNAYDTGRDTTRSSVYFENTAAPLTFTAGGTSDITGRSKTTAFTTWNPTNTGTGFQIVPTTGDLVTELQEIVDAVSPTAFVAIIQPTPNPNDVDGYYSRDFQFDSSLAGKLDIDFTAGGAAGPANLKTYDTNATANIKTANTNTIANMKTMNTNV